MGYLNMRGNSEQTLNLRIRHDVKGKKNADLEEWSYVFAGKESWETFEGVKM